MPTAIRFSFFLLFIFIIVRTVAALSWKNSDALPQFASFQPRHVRQIPCTLFVSPSADAAVISILFILFFFAGQWARYGARCRPRFMCSIKISFAL